MKSISYGRQDISEEDIAAVVEVLRSDYLTQGPRVEAFEAEIARFLGARHALAVSSGTAALHLAALALGVQPGHRVLVASNTFVASANCIRYCGGDVEFVDIDPATLCMDLKALARMVCSKPKGYYKGIVAVDFAGFAMNFQEIRKIANAHGLWIIEDACHALGGEFMDTQGIWHKAGNGAYADAAVFSFHPVKHIATGEGGMVVTQNADLAQKIRLLRSHGIEREPTRLKENHGPWYYEMQALGYNFRMPDILCALGISQLRRFEANLTSRRKIADLYRDELKVLPLQLPLVPEWVRHAYHLYVVHLPARDDLYAFLKKQQIHCQIHYIPVHQQPYYRDLYGKQTLPNAEKHYAEALSLPMYHALSKTDQRRVIEVLQRFFG